MRCDFCRAETESVYKHVHLCPKCGLVQNEPSSNRAISTSCEADQGNLRNGKNFRFPLSLPILESLDWSQIKTALDIGSNRGAFVHWMTANNPHVEVAAVEPEGRLVEDYPAMVGRFEDFNLSHVDFVFSSHTLEHAQSAHAMMQATERLMPIGSHMLLEVPNLATIQDPRVVEEFFIYKHNWHFSTVLMVPYLLDMGFEVERDESTMFDIRLLLRKTRSAIPWRGFSFAVDVTREWLADYERNMQRNRAVLPDLVDNIRYQLCGVERGRGYMPWERAPYRIAFWGGGRIFDALVRYGHLDPRQVVVDKHLTGVVDFVHPVEYLAEYQPDCIVVLGRTSSDQMADEAKKYAPRVVTFNDLLDEAVGR